MHPNTFYRVSVKALIKNPQGHILVLKENQDTWSLPGGGLDHGEDPKVGIARELKEELGVDATNIGDVMSVKTFYLESKRAWLLWIVYGVHIENQNFTLGGGVTEAEFIPLELLRDSQDIFEQMVYKVGLEVTGR